MQPKLKTTSQSESPSFLKPSTRAALISVWLFTIMVAMGLGGGIVWWFTQRHRTEPDSIQTTDSQHHFSHNIKTSLPSHSKDFTQHFSSKEDFVSGQFNYGGSAAWIPIAVKVDPVLQGARPEFRLRYTLPSSGVPSTRKGIGMLLDNQLAFAHASRPIHSEEYQKALQNGYTLNEITVALEAIVVIVNPQLDIDGLTLAQLRDIYIGKIRNWKQVGGPDLPITPYSLSPDDSGVAEFFDHHVMKDLPFGENVIFVPTPTRGVSIVAKNLGGIYYASGPQVIGQCSTKPLPIGYSTDQLVAPYQEPLVLVEQCPEKRNRINMSAMEAGHYPILQPLIVIVKRNGRIEEQAGEAYVHLLLTDEGQELMRQAGFIPIRCLSHFVDQLGTCHYTAATPHHE